MKNFLWLILFVFVACSRSDKKALLSQKIALHKIINGDTLIECDLHTKIEDVVTPLSTLIDSFEIVKLDSSEKALVSKGIPIVSEHYIAYYRSFPLAAKLFDRKGNYITDIGHIGQGPGEYLASGFFLQIDEENSFIYLIGLAARNLFVYSLHDGTFLKDIPLAHRVSLAEFVVSTHKQEVTVLTLPLKDGFLWKQDFEGNVLQEIPAEIYRKPPYASSLIGRWGVGIDHIYLNLSSSELGVTSLQTFPVKDTLYHYNDDSNRLIPRFTAIYKNNNDIPVHWTEELPGHYLLTLLVPAPVSTGAHFVPDQRILIDKKTLHGGNAKFVIDALGNFPIENSDDIRFRKRYFTCCIDPLTFRERIIKLLSSSQTIPKDKRHYLEELAAGISEDDNEYIFIGKLKK